MCPPPDAPDAAHADYLERLAGNFTRVIPHARAIGVRVLELRRGLARCELPLRPEFLADPGRGRVSNGIVTTLVDSTAGLAVFAALDAPERVATLDLRMDYLRAGDADEPLRCESECFRLTRHIAFVRSRVWQHGADGDLAVSQGAFMRAGKSS